jgi:DNA-binding GntR family transcriptional regulator
MSKMQYAMDDNSLRTREELVADAIRAAILQGTFKPGQKLDQQQLCEDLGVSRSPLRVALRTLAAEGLVTIIPNQARRGAPRMDDERLEKLAGIFERADKTDDVEEILRLNNEFHGTIYSAYPQPVLMSHIQQLRNKVAAYNRVYLGRAGSKEVAWAGHRRIYEACVRRDGEEAEAETSKHLEEVFRSIAEASQASETA